LVGEDNLAGEAEADAGSLRLGGEEGQKDVLRERFETPGPLSETSIWTSFFDRINPRED